MKKSKIPKHWKWVNLEDIGIVVSGGTPSTKDPEFWNGNIPWITPADLSGYEDVYIQKGIRNISQVGLEYSSAHLLPENSIVFSSRAPIGYVAITKNDLATNQGFKNLILPSDLINPKFVYYYFKTIKELAESMASGTTFLELSASKFKQIPFPLAPINEQEKIVEKVEELFSELDSILSNFEILNSKLEVYWFAEINSFFKGKKEYIIKDTIIAPQKILEEIEENRFLLEKKYNGRNNIDNQSVVGFDLPNHWKLVKLSDLYVDPVDSIADGPFGSNLKSDDFQEFGYPVLKIQNIDRNKLNSKNITFISKEKFEFLKKHHFTSGDIIITKLGSPLGKACIVPDNLGDGVIVADLIRIKQNEYINSKFLMYSLNSPYIISQIEKLSKGTTRQRITLNDVRNLVFVFPNLEEQELIVRNIEELDDEINSLSNIINESCNNIRILKQKILQDSFSGSLIPSDIDNENIESYCDQIKVKKEEYLFQSKEKQQNTVKTKRVNINMDLLEILKNEKNPISSHTLWQKSIYKNDIEEFYKKLKELESKIREFKEGYQSFIELL